MAALRWRTQAHHLSSDDFEFSGFGRLGARPGLAIYGGQPSSVIDLRLPVEPVLKLKSRIMMLNQVATGERVSYNGLWRAERQSLIAVVPVGYADGYKRSLSNRGWVLCRGSRVPVVGAVCMDYLMIDVTDIKGAPLAIGEDLVLLGTQAGDTITVEELASWASTISFEILTGISGRVPRRYLNGTE